MSGIKEVAKHAGVSISTVSNAINGTKYVSEDLKQRISHAIEALNYEADPLARSFKSKKSMNLGVVITNIGRVFFPQVIKGIQEEADRRGFSLSLCNTDDSFEKEAWYIRMLVNNWADGIILDSVAAMEDEEYFKRLAGLGRRNKRIPVVSIERRLDRYGIDSVATDNFLGGRMAGAHLADAGCRKIAHITGPAGSCMSKDRLDGIEKELNRTGLKLVIKSGDFSPLSGYMAIKDLLLNNEVPDGVFASNDQMAIGAIKAIHESGLRIPEDIKVIGFDNSFIASIIDPSLTTINVPKHELGVKAVDLLFKRLETPERDTECIELPIDLITRESTSLKAENYWDLSGW